MVRWRSYLVLALLLLMPLNTLTDDDDTDDEAQDENEDNDDADDSDDDVPEKPVEREAPRSPFAMPTPPPSPVVITRTVPRRPLECYVCSYKADAQLLKSCLDPTKYRTHTMSCHSLEDKCFTSVISKGGQYEAVMRGCRSGCTNSPETTCCEMNRCNNQAMTLPVVTQKAKLTVASVSKSNKTIPPTVLFFVTILLLLQTVVKVAVV